jgi:hypothetical protein
MLDHASDRHVSSRDIGQEPGTHITYYSLRLAKLSCLSMLPVDCSVRFCKKFVQGIVRHWYLRIHVIWSKFRLSMKKVWYCEVLLIVFFRD